MIVQKDQIEREARQAAAAGQCVNYACRYPFCSPAGRHFVDTYYQALRELQGSGQGQGAAA